MRLIDADALIEELENSKYMIYYNDSISRIRNNEIDRSIAFVEDAPTVTIKETKEALPDDALRIHENYIKALDRAIEIINKYYERGDV